jgi:hypothetical protein
LRSSLECLPAKGWSWWRAVRVLPWQRTLGTFYASRCSCTSYPSISCRSLDLWSSRTLVLFNIIWDEKAIEKPVVRSKISEDTEDFGRTPSSAPHLHSVQTNLEIYFTIASKRWQKSICIVSVSYWPPACEIQACASSIKKKELCIQFTSLDNGYKKGNNYVIELGGDLDVNDYPRSPIIGQVS